MADSLIERCNNFLHVFIMIYPMLLRKEANGYHQVLKVWLTVLPGFGVY